MKRRLLLILLCMPLLCGCSHTYLERQIYPICLSVDVDEEGKYQVGLQAPQGTAQGSAAYDILSATGHSPEEALRTLAASTPYPLNFSQIRLCLISYDLAATAPLRPLLRTLFELPTMRPNAYVMVALGNAFKVMQTQKPDFGMRLSTHLNMLFERLRREKTLPDSTLSYCVRELGDNRSDLLLCICAVNTSLLPEEEKATSGQQGGDGGGQQQEGESAAVFSAGEPWSDKLLTEDLVAGMLPRTSQNPVEYLGSATVSDGRVSGVLTAAETQLALRTLSDAKLRTAISGDRLQLQVILPKGSVLTQDRERIIDLIARLQALDCDALTFGRIASMAFYTDESWRAFDFDSRYRTAEVVVQTEE